MRVAAGATAEIVMPRLSDSMEEGTILAWLKAPGDTVKLGEEIVEIETDKANMVVESDASGTVLELVAAEGDTLPIGAVIAHIGDPAAASEAAPEDQEELEEPEAAAPPPVPRRGQTLPEGPDPGAASPADSAAPAQPGTATTNGGRLRVSPLARRIAADRGIDLATVTGSGPGGRIVRADVEAGDRSASAPVLMSPAPPVGAGTKTATAKGAVERIETTRLQSVVARRMAESKATVPHFYVSTEVDMTAASEARRRLKARADREDAPVPSFNDMVVRAVALSLRAFPRVNSSYLDGAFALYSRINIGIAVAAQDALVVPTIFDADAKGLSEIAADARALSVKVRDGSITPPELAGGTFTISNLGMYGMTSISPVVNPPQAAILGVGEIRSQPIVRDGRIEVGGVMTLTLAADHRILYGADAAAFLARIRATLEEPLGLAL